jgi:hypothetical protein
MRGTAVILHDEAYRRWIENRGVGLKDRKGDSRASYMASLRSTSEILGEDISPAMLSSEQDVTRIVQRLAGERSPKTISNYRSALRQYAAMIQASAHR